MKNSLMIVLALGLASPAAFADGGRSEPKPFAIAIKSDVTPVAHAALRYPYPAARLGLDGNCKVAFAVTPGGRAEDVQTIACTSEAFESAARSVVAGLKFASTSSGHQAVSATIHWDMEPASYASLR